MYIQNDESIRLDWDNSEVGNEHTFNHVLILHETGIFVLITLSSKTIREESDLQRLRYFCIAELTGVEIPLRVNSAKLSQNMAIVVIYAWRERTGSC